MDKGGCCTFCATTPFVWGQQSCPSLVTCHWLKDKICKQIFNVQNRFFTDKIIVSIFRTFLVLYYLGNPQPGFLPVSSDQKQVTPKKGLRMQQPLFWSRVVSRGLIGAGRKSRFADSSVYYLIIL